VSDTLSPAEDRRPVVIVIVGRQRVGKTTVANRPFGDDPTWTMARIRVGFSHRGFDGVAGLVGRARAGNSKGKGAGGLLMSSS